MRKTLTIAVAAAAFALTVAAGPAANAADPNTSATSSHGRLVQTVTNPHNRAQFVQIAVDTHYGFRGSPDSTADYVSGVGRISKGSGAVRVEVDDLRVGAEDATFVQDDFRISAVASPRNDGLTPARPLTSGTGSQALGYGDWRPVSPCGSPRVATRGFFSVRWADGSVTHPSLRDNYTDPNPTVCPTPDGSIHAAAPFQPLDSAVYTGPTTAQVGSTHSRVVNASTVDLVKVADEPASAGGTSLETNNLGVDLASGDTVSVDYALLDGGSTASGAVRLFLYCGDATSTPGARPSGAPDYVATAPAVVTTGGTLSVTTSAACAAGYAGLVYDTSNPALGRVRFTGLQVNTTPVSFL